MLVTELVTNAVLHGTGRGPSLTVEEVADGVLRVEVCDSSQRLPPRMKRAAPGVEQTHGRGLFLIESLATSWGSELLRSGKRVWFEVDGAVDSPSAR